MRRGTPALEMGAFLLFSFEGVQGLIEVPKEIHIITIFLDLVVTHLDEKSLLRSRL